MRRAIRRAPGAMPSRRSVMLGDCPLEITIKPPDADGKMQRRLIREAMDAADFTRLASGSLTALHCHGPFRRLGQEITMCFCLNTYWCAIRAISALQHRLPMIMGCGGAYARACMIAGMIAAADDFDTRPFCQRQLADSEAEACRSYGQ